MPAVASISLNDGQGTPVAHTFAPLTCTPGNTVLVNREGNTSAGNRTLVLSYDAAKANRATHRVGIRFNMPVEAQNADTGQYRVEYTARFSGEAVIPDRMTAAERADFAAFVANAIMHADVNDYIADLDPFY